MIIATAGPNTRARSVGDLNEDGHVHIVIVEGQSSDGSAPSGRSLQRHGRLRAAQRCQRQHQSQLHHTRRRQRGRSSGSIEPVHAELGVGPVGDRNGDVRGNRLPPGARVSNPVAGDLTRRSPRYRDRRQWERIRVLLNACGQPEADLGVTIAESADPIDEGGEVTHTMTLTNDSSNGATTSVYERDRYATAHAGSRTAAPVRHVLRGGYARDHG